MSGTLSNPVRKELDASMWSLLAFFVLFGVFAVPHLASKPDLPALPEDALTAGLTVDGIPVRNADELEFLLGPRRVGDTVMVQLGETSPFPVRLVSLHAVGSIAFDIFISLLIAGLGVLVACFHDDRDVARVFLAVSVALGVGLLGTRTIASLTPAWLGALLCLAFFFAYAAIPALFLHFMAIFPVRRFTDTKRFMGGVYALGLVVGAWAAVTYLRAISGGALEQFRESLPASGAMNGLMVAGVVSGIVILVGTWRKGSVPSERHKAAWILYGVCAGTLPFALLWALPQAAGAAPVIPEWTFKLFLLAIPLSFAIAILRYRLIDINALISRSGVHAILFGVLLIVFAGLMAATAGLVAPMPLERSLLLSAVAAVLAVLTYGALGGWLRHAIDRRLYRASYDFRGSLKEVLDGMKLAAGLRELGGNTTGGIERLIPVERIGLFVLEESGHRLRAVALRNFPGLEGHGVRFDPDHLRTDLHLPVAVPEHVEREVVHEPADPVVFGRWGIALALPMKSKAGEILGFLVLGRKSSGLGFTADDVDLLTVVAAQAAAGLERLALRRLLLFEQAESERLEELNRMKSWFVSSVSHDLKTPLTSIRMFAELLRTQKSLPAQTADDYLRIIEGESGRLTGLINNVLDFAKIERGTTEYRRREADLNDIVSRMAEVMQYQFSIEHCETSIELSGDPLTFEADPDAVLEALYNLVGNALKYTNQPKRITVRAFAVNGSVAVSVADNGPGIPAAESGAIFEPFRRGKAGVAGAVGGAGLGLSVVKHVAEGHGGTVRVEPAPGGGSVFTMSFPSGGVSPSEGRP